MATKKPRLRSPYHQKIIRDVTPANEARARAWAQEVGLHEDRAIFDALVRTEVHNIATLRAAIMNGALIKCEGIGPKRMELLRLFSGLPVYRQDDAYLHQGDFKRSPYGIRRALWRLVMRMEMLASQADERHGLEAIGKCLQTNGNARDVKVYTKLASHTADDITEILAAHDLAMEFTEALRD